MDNYLFLLLLKVKLYFLDLLKVYLPKRILQILLPTPRPLHPAIPPSTPHPNPHPNQHPNLHRIHHCRNNDLLTLIYVSIFSD